MLFKSIATFLSPPGKKGVLSILIFHRVLHEQDPLFPSETTAESFYWQVKELARNFNILPLSEAITRMYDGCLPARAACITFDDGYADNVEIALPILQRFNAPATFFIASCFLDGGRMWNDTIIETIRIRPEGTLDLSKINMGMYLLNDYTSRTACIADLIKKLKHLPPNKRIEYVEYIATKTPTKLPDNLMMTTQQLQKLQQTEGMDIGAHTATHPILTSLNDEAVFLEIESGRKQLEKLISDKVELFAYPNGQPSKDYSTGHTEIVRELGFKAALTTAWGVSTLNTNRWELPRFTPWDQHPFSFNARLLANCRRRIC